MSKAGLDATVFDQHCPTVNYEWCFVTVEVTVNPVSPVE